MPMSSTDDLILKSTFFLYVLSLSLQLAYDLVYGFDVKVEVKSGRVELELRSFCELIATGYSDETWTGIDPHDHGGIHQSKKVHLHAAETNTLNTDTDTDTVRTYLRRSRSVGRMENSLIEKSTLLQ